MSRAERLLELMQSLRLRRRPVAGQALAEELGVSLRTLYRDIEALKAQGARIEGEAGFGYVLKPGFTLPPLMFTIEEIEALALGARWVEGRADAGLSSAARNSGGRSGGSAGGLEAVVAGSAMPPRRGSSRRDRDRRTPVATRRAPPW